MNPEAPLHRRAAAIFDAAITLTHTAEREELLARECLGDLVLEQRVRALLRAHEEAGSFLEQPNAQLAAELERLRPEEAGERIGHYKLLQQIGEGGFGTVWMAEQEQPVRRRVALKIIKLGMDTKEVIARFEQERQALALMDHPNIARVFDAGVTPFGRPFFVMELVRGVRITDYCDEQQLPTHERLELFIQVCQAVQHAHQKGIIHRDLKPSNILVTINDGVAVPKVIDFGVAKATQGRLVDSTVFTRFEQMIGTPLYMSPEQAEMTSLDIDTRSDIYSLGVLLYELLTGRTPIDAATLREAGLDEMRRVIREVDPPRPSLGLRSLGEPARTTAARRRRSEPARLTTLLRGDLDWIAMKCLEKDRKRRYDTATALAADLRRHLLHEPIEARPPTTLYRLHKAFARHRRAVLGLGVLALALLLAGGAALQLIRAKGERNNAEQRRAFESVMAAGLMGDDAGMLKQLEVARPSLTEPQVLMLRGSRSLMIGQYEAAIRDLRAAVTARPDSAAALGLLAVAHFQNGEWDAYERDLAILRPLPATIEEDLTFKGFAVAYTWPDEGFALLDEAIRLRKSPLALAIRAEVGVWKAMRNGRFADVRSALEDIAVVKSFTPRNPAILGVAVSTRLLAAGIDLAQRDTHLAAAEADARLMEELARAEPDRPGAIGLRAMQLQALGRDDDATALLREQYTRSGEGLVAQRYALELLRLGQPAEALRIIRPERSAVDAWFHLRIVAELPDGPARVLEGYRDFRQRYAGTSAEVFAPLLPLLLGKKDVAIADARAFRSRAIAALRRAPAPLADLTDFFAGEIDAAQLELLAGEAPLHRAETHVAIAYWLLADGDRAGAQRHFEQALKSGAFLSNAFLDSRIALAQLQRDPAWPAWIPPR